MLILHRPTYSGRCAPGRLESTNSDGHFFWYYALRTTNQISNSATRVNDDFNEICRGGSEPALGAVAGKARRASASPSFTRVTAAKHSRAAPALPSLRSARCTLTPSLEPGWRLCGTRDSAGRLRRCHAPPLAVRAPLDPLLIVKPIRPSKRRGLHLPIPTHSRENAPFCEL